MASAVSFAADKQIELNLPEAYKPIEWALNAQLDALGFIENGRLVREIVVKHKLPKKK